MPRQTTRQPTFFTKTRCSFKRSIRSCASPDHTSLKSPMSRVRLLDSRRIPPRKTRRAPPLPTSYDEYSYEEFDDETVDVSHVPLIAPRVPDAPSRSCFAPVGRKVKSGWSSLRARFDKDYAERREAQRKKEVIQAAARRSLSALSSRRRRLQKQLSKAESAVGKETSTIGRIQKALVAMRDSGMSEDEVRRQGAEGILEMKAATARLNTAKQNLSQARKEESVLNFTEHRAEDVLDGVDVTDQTYLEDLRTLVETQGDLALDSQEHFKIIEKMADGHAVDQSNSALNDVTNAIAGAAAAGMEEEDEFEDSLMASIFGSSAHPSQVAASSSSAIPLDELLQLGSPPTATPASQRGRRVAALSGPMGINH